MKHIVVTGGAKGIGRAIVEELAADYKVTATYNGSQAAADELSAKYANVTFVQVDLRDRSALDGWLATMMTGEAVDVLMNNAGIYIGKPFDKMSEDELFNQSDLNFAAPARMIQALLPVLQKAPAPLIINMSSQSAMGRLTGEAMYSAAKAALSTLSFVLRAELNPKGIRVTAIEPYGVNTYGAPEPSGMVLPSELAKTVRYIVEQPGHFQLDTVVMSHIDQPRPDYPEWIER